MNVLLLPNEEEANRLRNIKSGHRRFKPIQDANGNWVITLFELNHPAFASQYETLVQYPIIEWQPAD